MTRLRRSTAIALTLVLAAVAAACGGSGSDESTGEGADGELPSCPVEALDTATTPVEVVVWHSLQAKQEDALSGLAEDYNASQDRVRVRLEAQGASDTELTNKFTAAIPSRQLPAVLIANESTTQFMVDSGVILPATSCAEASDTSLDPFVDTVRANYTIDDAVWPATVSASSQLLYYNKDHFRRAGLDPERPPGTLAEVRAAAEAIEAAGVADTPLVHELRGTKIEYWLTGAESTIVDNGNGREGEPTEATIADNPQALELFTWFDEMNDDGLLLPIPVAEGKIDQYLALANGQGSMMIEPSGAATSIQAFLGGQLDTAELGATGAEASGLELGAGEFPGLEAPGRTQVGGQVWFMTSTTPPEVQAAAWDFVTFINEEDSQVRQLTEGSFLPYLASAATSPAAEEFYAASLAGGWLEIANQQLADVDPEFLGPLIGPYEETRTALSDALTAVVTRGTSPEDALAEAQTRIDEALEDYAAGGF
jgi:sn-glycerol 3-phosphate transport system substrate-binding protein